MSASGRGSEISTAERAYAGVIVTFVNTETGQTRVEHRGGYRRETNPKSGPRATVAWGAEDILRVLTGEADAWEGDWKIQSISTPTTILADIRGRKRGDALTPWPPEPVMLANIDRSDMWAPGLRTDPRKLSRERERRRAGAS